jgi:N-acetylglucosamine transport system substrate-binding protein
MTPRRTHFRSILRSAVLAALLPLTLAGCRLDPPARSRKTVLDVAVFEGGYGIAWHKAVARAYEKRHPEIEVNVWGDPRVEEKIKPRILRGDPPDLAACSLPVWKLIVAGKLYPLNAALDTPAYDMPGKTWRQSLVPGVLGAYDYQGSTYAMPTSVAEWLCWYDRKLFREHGWQEPRTWGEFNTLCDKIKAAGIAPLAFQGKYPRYGWYTLLSLYQRLVPMERWYRIENLEPRAFEDPEFIHAARLVQEMAEKNFEPGALAMTHTESQTEWCKRNAAMVFCGAWLENEMKDTLPPDFEMASFPVPMVEGGKGDPRALYAGGDENMFIFAQAKHPREAADFLKFMTSIGPARDYTRELHTLAPVQGCDAGIPISSALKSAVGVLRRSDQLFQDRLSGLYLTFYLGTIQDNMGELVAGKVTPEAFGKRLQAAADALRRDPTVYKPPAIAPGAVSAAPNATRPGSAR